MSLEIKYLIKSSLAHEPKMATSGSAASDLFSLEDKKYSYFISDFRGEVNVIIFNHSNKRYEVKVLDKIVQIVFQRREIPSFVRCDELSKTSRGLGGFGSTGTSLFFLLFRFLKKGLILR